MNRNKLLLSLTLSALCAGTIPALAAIDFSNASGFYNPDDWYAYRSNSNVQFTESDGAINFSQLDASSYLWAYFNPVSLDVGEEFMFSGSVTFGKIASGGKFSLGIFSSGLCSQNDMSTHSFQSDTPEITSMKNYTTGKKVVGTVMGV